MTEDLVPRSGSDTVEVVAQLALFGFDSTEARVLLRPRSRSWRLWGALRTQAAGLVLAPAVGLVPPHAPWALGALAVSFMLARRRWRHLFTVEGVAGKCPKCGAPVSPRVGMLRQPHPVPCDGCHHDLTLALPDGALNPPAPA
ncbi:MAG TPA: hypothetical protein VLA36_15505 [Longimicrobiales bacterium]|nr:hypothetical protein [Longimicrobiales bacterium]